MTIQNKQVNIVTDLNVNSNNIIDAKINAYNNTITNLAVNNFTSGAIKTSIGNSEDASDIAIPTEKAVRTAVDGLLNEFIVTEEIFETYKNQYGFVDLKDLFDNFDLEFKVINLNGFNYLMNELTLAGSPFTRYAFKNGNILFDSVGRTFGSDISEGCSQALNAENCDVIFKDCIFDARKLYDSTKPVIALNGCSLEFHNCNINILFISEKTFIETLNFNNINFDDTDVYLSENSSYNYSGTDNNFSITGIKTNGGGVVTALNARIEINNNNTTGNFEPENKFLVTAQDTTTRFAANNAEILIYGYGNKKRSLDINLDNKDIHIVNSTIDGDIYVRRESEFEIEQNHTYNKGDIFYKFSDILESWSDRSDIIDTITVNGTTFATAVDNTSDTYEFEYNGSNWELDGETVILADYGITYTLQSGESLESGCDIQVNFVYNAILGFEVSANTFTPTSTDLNYLDTCVQADEIFRIGVEPVYNFNNSIIINKVDPEDFFFRNKKGIFCANKFLSDVIETEDFYTEQLDIGNSLNISSDNYFLPINVDGLSADNVKDAISELASGNSLPSQEGQSGKFLTTNGTTASWTTINSAKLYDIKTMAQTIADKGWCNISKKKVLNKTTNPTIYNDIKNKYDNAEIGTINVNTTQNYAFDLYEYDNKIYFCGNYDYKVYSTTDIDLSNLTEVADLKSIFDTTFNDDISVHKVCKGINVILAFGSNFNGNVFILKLDFSYNVLKSYRSSWTASGNVKCYSVLGKFIFSIDYGIYWDNDSNSDITLNILSNSQAINALTYDSNSGDVYIQLKNVYEGNDGLAYTNISNLSLSTVKSLPENTIHSDVCYFNNNLYFMCNANGTLVAFKSTNNGTNWVSINNNIESISGKPIIAIFSNKAYVQISSGNLYSTTNFIDFAVEIENTNNSYSSIFISNLGYYATSNSYDSHNLNDVVYAGVGIKVFTDTYSINGNSISIDYYKNSSSQTKIVFGTSQNTDIDTVTEYLGYNSYFVLDTTVDSENVQLPINTNLWTYMFVGDDYIETDFASGNSTRLLPQAEIIEDSSASVSLDVKGNKNYKLSASALTALTLSSCEDSQLRTTIRFTSGATATIITDSASIDWIDGAIPIPSANVKCLIFIWNKIGFYKEW